MAGAGGDEFSGGDRQDPQPGRHKHAVLIALAEAVVDVEQDLGRAGIYAGHGHVLDQGLGNDHEQGRRNALAGDIRHDAGEMVVVDQEEIIEISSHLLGGVHDRVEIEFLPVRECREMHRQHVRLDVRRDGQLRVEALLLRRDLHDLLDVAAHFLRHVREGPGKHLDLVAGQEDVLHVEGHVVSVHAGDAHSHALDRLDQAVGEDQGGQRRQEDQEGRDEDRREHQVGGIVPQVQDGILRDGIRLLSEQVGRAVQVLLGDHEQLRPTDRLDRGVGDVDFLAVYGEEREAVASLQRLRHEGHEFRVAALLQALELIAARAQLPFAPGGVDQVSVFIDQARVAHAAQTHLRDDLLQFDHPDGAAADGRQLPVHIDGHACHHLISVEIVVQVHRGKICPLMHDSSRVPGPPLRVVRLDLSAAVQLPFRRGVHDDAGASRQGHHAVEQGLAPLHDLQHHVAQAADPEDLLIQLRVGAVGVRRVEQLQGELARVRLRRERDFHRRIGRRLLQHHLHLPGQHLQIVPHGPELPVQDLRLGEHVLLEALRRHLLHGIRHGVHDHGVLLPVRLLHEVRETAHLHDAEHGKDDDRRSDQHDIHSEHFDTKALFHSSLSVSAVIPASGPRPGSTWSSTRPRRA